MPGASKAVIPGLVTLTVLRLPSLMEPHWYTDEAGYENVARSLLGGKVLYSQTWNNKPPLMLWTIAAEVKVFGTSETGLHVLTLIAGLLTVAAIVWAANRLYTPRRALVAGVIAGVALGLPILDAELAIPESLMVAPLSWAGAILLVHILRDNPGEPAEHMPRWTVGVGLLMAMAICYQQTAVAETSAFFLAMLLAPKVRTRDALVFLVTVVTVTAAWLLAAIITAGAGNVAFALAGFYIGYTQRALPSSASSAALHFLLAGVAAALIGVGALLARRLERMDWVLLLWAGATLVVTAVAGQPYPHFLAPAVAPVTLLMVGVPALSLARLRAGWTSNARLVPALAGVIIAAVMARVAGFDWLPAVTLTPGSTHSLTQYYGGAIQAALDPGVRITWDDEFDQRVGGDSAVAAWLDSKGLAGSTSVVWSSDSWLYALADLEIILPTPPIYNDEVLLGFNGPVEQFVAAARPLIIVTASDALHQFPEIVKLLDGVTYVNVFNSYPDAVWVRAGSAARLP